MAGSHGMIWQYTGEETFENAGRGHGTSRAYFMKTGVVGAGGHHPSTGRVLPSRRRRCAGDVLQRVSDQPSVKMSGAYAHGIPHAAQFGHVPATRLSASSPSADDVPTTSLCHANEAQQADPCYAAAPPGDWATTLVVRNVPRYYDLEGLLREWTPDGSFDLVHFPYNIKAKRRLGFCFINFISHRHALEFRRHWHARTFPGHDSSAELDINFAKLQGLPSILELFRGKKAELMTDTEILPATFSGTQRLDTRRLLLQFGIITFSV